MNDIEGNYIKSFRATLIEKRIDEKERPYLVLDRTSFYPEGGGQPTDTGTFSVVTEGSGDPIVLSVIRVAKKNDIRHYVQEVELLDDIAIGAQITAELNWAPRYEHMRMHTAQHLVSSIVYDMYNAATVGNQIHAKTSRIDFSPLSHDQVDTEKIELQCNKLIEIDPPVRVLFQDRSEIEGSRDAERCNVHLIPQSVRELRIVKIQDVELCPCAGTHIKSLGEVKGIRILSVRSKGKGKVRLTYELS